MQRLVTRSFSGHGPSRCPVAGAGPVGHEGRRLLLPGLVFEAWVAPEAPRRQLLLLPGVAIAARCPFCLASGVLGGPLAASAAGFSPNDLGMSQVMSSCI